MKLRSCFALLLGTLLISNTSVADVIGVADPTGWSRSDAEAGFVVFDSFTADSSGRMFGSPSQDSGGGFDGTLSQALEIAFPGGIQGDPAPSDNALYLHTSAAVWSLNLTSADFDVNYVQLQIKEQAGDGLASIPFLLDGAAADSINVYDDGNSNSITSFFWELNSTIPTNTAFTITAGTGPFTFDAYDSFSVDASSTFTAVPEPSGLGLLAFAGCLTLCRRRRK